MVNVTMQEAAVRFPSSLLDFFNKKVFLLELQTIHFLAGWISMRSLLMRRPKLVKLRFMQTVVRHLPSPLR